MTPAPPPPPLPPQPSSSPHRAGAWGWYDSEYNHHTPSEAHSSPSTSKAGAGADARALVDYGVAGLTHTGRRSLLSAASHHVIAQDLSPSSQAASEDGGSRHSTAPSPSLLSTSHTTSQPAHLGHTTRQPAPPGQSATPSHSLQPAVNTTQQLHAALLALWNRYAEITAEASPEALGAASCWDAVQVSFLLITSFRTHPVSVYYLLYTAFCMSSLSVLLTVYCVLHVKSLCTTYCILRSACRVLCKGYT